MSRHLQSGTQVSAQYTYIPVRMVLLHPHLHSTAHSIVAAWRTSAESAHHVLLIHILSIICHSWLMSVMSEASIIKEPSRLPMII